MELQSVIFFYKCKMVPSNMAALSLKWLYLNFNLTQKGFMVQYIQYNQLNYHRLIVLTNPRWRHPRWGYPKWRHFVVLRRSTALSPQLHSNILEGNRGNCRYHFESIILVVGGFQTFMNLLL